MSKTDELKTALAARGLRYVGTRGNTSAPVCLVGEAAGAEEDQSGLPFVGASGRELDRMLEEAGVHLGECWWTNPYKTRPPDNKLDRLSELGVALELHEAVFWEELDATKPTFIIPCGVTPLGLLCPQIVDKRTGSAQISKWRGSLLRSPRLAWPHYIIPCFHPAYLFRAWEDRPAAVLCLAKAAEELAYWKSHNGKLQPLPQRQLIGDPSYHDACDFLRQLLQAPDTLFDGAAGSVVPISIDIENIGVYRGKYKTKQRNRLPYVVGFCNDPALAMSIGLAEYDNAQTCRIWRLIDQLLRAKRQVGQNYTTHDAPWLEHLGFRPEMSLVDDTLVRHHVLWPELSHKLDFQTFQYSREPYYKDEGKSWSVKERQRMKVYNCKDVAVTLEIFNAQQQEFAADPARARFYHDYEMPLARAFFEINKRGLRVDPARQNALRTYLTSELQLSCTRIQTHLPGTVVIAQAPDKKKLPAGTLNLSSPPQILTAMKSLGLKPPIKHGRGTETSDEEALNELFAATGHPFLKELLRVRELNKTLGTYVDVELEDSIFYSAYFVTGTVTGRRSSRANFLGLGGNGQNLPKHSDLGKRVRECFVAREGKIFVACDQVSAEDWVIQGLIADLSGDRSGLLDLAKPGRHDRLASFIFSKPVADCGGDSPERYMAKRVRYAASFDMGAFQFAATMAKEGFVVPQSHCEFLLNKFHTKEPAIKQIFQQYIIDRLTATRELITPFGRRRQFFSLRPYADNKRIFKEGFAQIPQSTVGDNTGMSILWLERNFPDHVVADGHDAVVLEVNASSASVIEAVEMLQKSFDRVIRFPNGLELTIPIEFEIGYDLAKMKKCQDLSATGLTNMFATLPKPQNHQSIIISGPPPQSLVEHSSVMSG